MSVVRFLILIGGALAPLFAIRPSEIMDCRTGTVYEYRTINDDEWLFSDSLTVNVIDTVLGPGRPSAYPHRPIHRTSKYVAGIDSNLAVTCDVPEDSTTWGELNDIPTRDSLRLVNYVYNLGIEWRYEKSQAEWPWRQIAINGIGWLDSILPYRKNGPVSSFRHDGGLTDSTIWSFQQSPIQFRISDKCGPRGRYQSEFIYGIGIVRVTYVPCRTSTMPEPFLAFNPEQKDYYLAQIRRSDTIIYTGQRLTSTQITHPLIMDWSKLTVLKSNGQYYGQWDQSKMSDLQKKLDLIPVGQYHLIWQNDQGHVYYQNWLKRNP
jgi:hypothetical protein